MRATWQRLRRASSQVKWEHGEQRRVEMDGTSHPFLPQLTVIAASSCRWKSILPYLEMMSADGTIRRGQGQAFNQHYQLLDQSNLRHLFYAYASTSNISQSCCEIWRGNLFQMNPLIILNDMLIKCYDAQIYGILSQQLVPLSWGYDWILSYFKLYVVNTPETAIRPLHLFLIRISPWHQHLQK